MKTKKSQKEKMREFTGVRSKANLNFALSEINKKHGDGSLMRLGDKKTIKCPVISTGTIGLDLATGIGGVPRGRVTEIFGREGSGKTTLALHIVAECQKNKGTVAFIDSEHALKIEYAQNLGVDIDNLLLSQPTTAEEALDIADTLVKSASVDLIIIDSVAAMCTNAELLGTMGQSHVGLLPRLMSQALRKLTASVHKTKTCFIFINQIRMKVNMGPFQGNPEITPGGVALKFHASMRIDVRHIQKIQKDEATIGSRVRVRVIKNKMASPYRSTELDLIFGKGFSSEASLIEVGIAKGIIKQRGSWYDMLEMTFQGKEKLRQWLEINPKDPAILKEINEATE